MPLFPRVLLFVFIAAVAQATAATPNPSHYIDPTKIDLKAILGDPPADKSPETLKEIDLLLAKQDKRTPTDVARAEEEIKLSPFVFSEVLGPWFNAKDLPLTATLLSNVEQDANDVSESAKTIWNRPRPPLQDSRIHPAVDLPKSGSYPSGHSTRGVLFSLVIAELVPDKRDALIARGLLVGEDRMIAGVHFPSDVEAGRTLGRAIFAYMSNNDQFTADLAKAKEEVAKRLAKN